MFKHNFPKFFLKNHIKKKKLNHLFQTFNDFITMTIYFRKDNVLEVYQNIMSFCYSF